MNRSTATIAFEIAPTEEYLSGHEVHVSVDGVDITRSGTQTARMGMSPFDLLIPVNRLVAVPTPSRITIARCSCGAYDVNGTDVVVTRTGGTVTWQWRRAAPMDHDVMFAADAYDSAVVAVGNDHGWEGPDDTAARTVLEAIHARSDLRTSWAAAGLTLGWVEQRDGELMVSFDAGGAGEEARDHQVFVRFAGGVDLVPRLLDMLGSAPQTWDATYIVCRPGEVAPRPAMAGPTWRTEFPRRAR